MQRPHDGNVARGELRQLVGRDAGARHVRDLVDATCERDRETGALEHVCGDDPVQPVRLCDDRLHCLCWDDAQAMDPATVDILASILCRGRADGQDSGASAKPGSTLPPPSLTAPFGLRAVFVLSTRSSPWSPPFLVSSASAEFAARLGTSCVREKL